MGLKPSVSYGYYRWRWLARFNAFWSPLPVAGYWTVGRVLGRVTMKTKAHKLWDESCRLQREIFAANCTETRNWLSSPDARNTLVQGHDRRNVRAHLQEAHAYLPAEGQSGERE